MVSWHCCALNENQEIIPKIKALAEKAIERKEILLLGVLTRELWLIDVEHFDESFTVITAI